MVAWYLIWIFSSNIRLFNDNAKSWIMRYSNLCTWCPVEIMAIGNALYSVQLFQSIKRYAFNFVQFKHFDENGFDVENWSISSSMRRMINDYNKSKTDFCLFFHDDVNFMIKLYISFIYIYNQKILLLIVNLKIFFSQKKITPKFSQFTRYIEKVIFPDKIQRMK